MEDLVGAGPLGLEVRPVLRHVGVARRGVGPPGALVDPGADELDLGLGQRGGLAGHPLVGRGEEEDLDEGALGSLPREDGLAGDASLHGQSLRVEAELALGLFRAVAFQAGRLEDRLDVPDEVDLGGLLSLEGPRQEKRRQKCFHARKNCTGPVAAPPLLLTPRPGPGCPYLHCPNSRFSEQ